MNFWVSLFVALFAGHLAFAGEATLAVSSNFLTTAQAIVGDFEDDTGHEIAISHGSTGQLYAQIEKGAPYDIFFAGDEVHPALLRKAGAVLQTRTYAFGRLALVSRDVIAPEAVGEALLGKTVALADPIVAPYGKAATRAMERLNLDTASFRPVLLANVGQVASVFATGNADAAFVAVSQVPALNAPGVIPLEDLIPDIRQDAALLLRAETNEAAQAFWDWLKTDKARALIAASGYGLPDG